MISANTLKKTFYILDKKNINKLLLILILTLLNTFFELLGISLIIPILTYFINENLDTYLETFFYFKDKNKKDLLIYVLLLFNFAYLCKFSTSLILVFQKNKYIWNLFSDLSGKVFSIFLNKKFLLEIDKNIAKKIQLVRGEANQFSFAVINPIIDLLIEIILFVSICIFLLIYNFKISLILIAFFLTMSFFWNRYYNDYLKVLGNQRRIYSIGAINEIQNSFGNFKETLIYKLGSIFFDRFEYFNKNNSKVGYKRDTITQLPRLFLELLSVTTILIISIVLIYQNVILSEILILIGVFVFATVRMLPSVAKIIRSMQTIRFNNVVVEKIYDEINYESSSELKANQNLTKIDFKKLQINNVSYNYPKNDNAVLKNINLEILKNKHLGFVGKTGSGKTTLINIICGFIKISTGKIILNDHNFFQNINNWQNIIGYVPHDVFILNESIEYNIAFEKDDKINKEMLNNILKKTDLKNFINNFEKKEKTIVGERGNDLSRGQCQRIGIARALYKKPQVLILDEATSALDVNTERKILENLYDPKNNLTIISISHRENSLQFCDKIYKIENASLHE